MAVHLLGRCLVVGVTLAYVVTAVRWEQAAYRVRPESGLVNDPKPMTMALLRTILTLQSETVLHERDSVYTAQGTIVKRLVEEYKGNQVRNSQVDVSLRPDGLIDRVGGRITQGLDQAVKELDSDCILSDEELLAVAMEYEGYDFNQVTVQHKDINHCFHIRDDGSVYRQASVDVSVTINATDGVFRNVYRMDACTGLVIDTENHTTTNMIAQDGYSTGGGGRIFTRSEIPCEDQVWGRGGNEKSGFITYGSQPYCLNITIRANGSCALENDYIRVIDLEHGVNENTGQVVSFPCLQGYHDEFNGSPSPALDAFFYASQVGKMFREWYSFSPLTSPVPRAYVHFGHSMDNALWDGQNVLLGDGGNATFPYSVLDSIAHELAHGVTERSSNLEFRGQSGGVNEAFSDMTGELAEKFLYGTNDWVVGAHICKDPSSVFRYFEEPSLDNKSISHVKDFRPNMDVHFSSGVFNRVFFLVAQTLDVRRAYEGFLVANRIYWQETITFEEAACDVIKGAYDSGLDMEVFESAFLQVGIEFQACPPFSDFVLPITGTEIRDNLRLSLDTQPIFKVTASSSISGFSASVVGGVNPRLRVMTSYSSLPQHELKSSVNSIDFVLSPNTTVYLRLSSDDPEEQAVSLNVTIH